MANVYVVGFHPNSEVSAIGGFDWYYDKEDAIWRMIELLNKYPAGSAYELDSNYVLARITVPDGLEKGEITTWINRNLELIELPLQEEVYANEN